MAPACLIKTSRRSLTGQDDNSKAPRNDQTPQQQVFSDTKLLEAILAHVDDMRCILLSQRVNRTVRDAIRGSPLLRQRLWLEPNPDIQLWHLGRLNPLLSRSVSRKKHKHILALSHSGCDVCMLTTMNAQKLEINGSWRDMLLYQPHSPFVVFKTADCWASSESYSQHNFKDAPTAGQLVQMSTTRSQDTSAQRLMQERPFEYDRKCGHRSTAHDFGRAKVLVP